MALITLSSSLCDLSCTISYRDSITNARSLLDLSVAGGTESNPFEGERVKVSPQRN